MLWLVMSNKATNVSSIEDVEDDSLYFVVETHTDGSGYAYYVKSDHLRTCFENGSYEDYEFLTRMALNDECDIGRYIKSDPVCHIVKVG